jgi:aminoglycoside 6'-N-acetyltransferase I
MIDVRVLRRQESSVLDHVAEGVFDGAVDPRWTAEFLADSRHHLAVALDAGLVVGMASGVRYVHPDKPPELWINEVGVAPSHQGHGIGKRLLRALLEHASTLGCTEAWVLTDADNVVAQRLYRGAGGEPERAQPVMFTFPLLRGDEPPAE